MNVSAVSNSFVQNYTSPLWKGTKELVSDLFRFSVDPEQMEVFERVAKRSSKKGLNDFTTTTAQAWKVSKRAVKDKSLWQSIKEAFTSIKPEFKAIKGSKFKGCAKILGKRLPLIGGLISVAMAVPTVYSAFTDKENGGGLYAGTREAARSLADTALLVGATAAGTALIPIPVVGSIVGMVAGSILSNFIFGKSFTEQRAETQEKVEAAKKEQQAKQGSSDVTSDEQPTQMAPLSPEEQQKYEKLKAAYENYAQNPFAQQNPFIA